MIRGTKEEGDREDEEEEDDSWKAMVPASGWAALGPGDGGGMQAEMEVLHPTTSLAF